GIQFPSKAVRNHSARSLKSNSLKFSSGAEFGFNFRQHNFPIAQRSRNSLSYVNFLESNSLPFLLVYASYVHKFLFDFGRKTIRHELNLTPVILVECQNLLAGWCVASNSADVVGDCGQSEENILNFRCRHRKDLRKHHLESSCFDELGFFNWVGT